MLIEDFPGCEKPNDEDVLWRYLDFTKFVSLIDRKALYFARADKMEDKYEGALSQVHVKFLPSHLRSMRERQKELRQEIYLSCWHINQHESAAMWKLYLKSNEGIAIQTSYRRLAESLAGWKYPLFPCKVVYLDYDKELIPGGNALYNFMHKRKSFEHEKEARIIYWHTNTELEKLRPLNVGPVGPLPPAPEEGVGIPLQLEMLIENVYVAPSAPEWFRQLTEAVLAKYGLTRKVIRSNLDQDPVW